MASITSWIRLEPRSRSVAMKTSLQARVYDPLWLLARQWQMGEFQGEDNGSPVMSRWRAEEAPLTRLHMGEIHPNDQLDSPRYDGSRMPLETRVEREAVHLPLQPGGSAENLRLAAETGQHFLRMLELQPLSQSYRGLFIRTFPFAPLEPEQRAALDADSLNYLEIVATRVPDGRRLYAALRSPGGGNAQLPDELREQIATGDTAEVEKALELWFAWCDDLFSVPGEENPAWSAERMEYSVSVATRLGDREHILTAKEFSEGHLDWYAFDENAEVTLGAAGDEPPREITRTAIPAPVSFRGMPALRFWEFEDAQVDFGSVEAGPADLARMLLVEFALNYSNDWFVIPVELAVGSLYRAKSLVVTDTFGVHTLIKASGERGVPHSSWRMFQHSHIRGSGLSKPEANLFFLPPSLPTRLESRPVEEVLFLRDEMANLAWGVERLVESPAGQPLNRGEAYYNRKQKRDGEASPPPETLPGVPRYRLSTEVPDYWVPLLPVRTEEGLRLVRGAVLALSETEEQQVFRAQGRILEAGQDLALFEEEVPREGLHVTRTYQLARWIDGSTHFWIGRRKGVGRGEGSSGLRFDKLEGKEVSG